VTLAFSHRGKNRPGVFECRVLRKIFGPKRDKATGDWSLMICTPHQIPFG